MNGKNKILITGGLGYVGGRLISFLNKETTYKIVISTRKEKLPPELLGDKFEHTNLSKLSQNAKLKLLNEIDSIIHLAALNEIDCVKYPELAKEINEDQTLELLELSHQANVRKFIYFSTAHVYRSPLEGVLNESSPCENTHPYALTHFNAEQHVLAYRNNYDLDAICIRLSNSFGPPAYNTSDRWTLLVNDLCRQAVLDKTLTLKSDGTQLRDFITLSDVEKAILQLINLNKKETKEGVFNLSSGKSIPVLEMTLKIQERATRILGYRPEITKKPTTSHNKTSLLIDNKRILKYIDPLLNDFDNEIDNMLRYCQNYFKND